MPSPSIIEFKIGACVNAPTKRLYALLRETQAACSKARNAMVRHWVRWREDNPEWTPAQRRVRDGSPKVTKDGKPVMESLFCSQDVENELYHVGRRVAPNVRPLIISHCRGEVVDLLKAKLPYNHEGTSRFRWEGVLAFEVASPSYKGDNPIPCPSADATLTCTESECTLEFSLLSKDSGYANTTFKVRLEKRQLSAGNRRLAEKIANTPKMLRDSKIVFKRGAWFFQCCYATDEATSTLDAERVCVLTPQTDKVSHPFELKLPDGRAWKMGHAGILEAEYTRLVLRRKTIRHRHKTGVGKGHGRGRFESIVQPWSRAYYDMEDRYRKQLCADIVEACERNNAGSLLYREPSLPLRERVWYGARGVPFDWTRFLSQLSHACMKRGIVLVQEGSGAKKRQPRIGIPGHKEEYPKQWPAAPPAAESA